MRLESDDKPNSAGSVIDLVRVARAALDAGLGGIVPEACALHMKSSPVEMEKHEALALMEKNWTSARR